MSVESSLQSDIIKWLRGQGCFVIKHNAGPGVPKGTPDLSFYCEGFYGFIEVKPSRKAPYQALQPERLKLLGEWSWSATVYPENWDQIRTELRAMI